MTQAEVSWKAEPGLSCSFACWIIYGPSFQRVGHATDDLDLGSVLSGQALAAHDWAQSWLKRAGLLRATQASWAA